MIFETESHKTLAEIDVNLRDAAARHKFGVLSVIDLKEKMQEKGVDFASSCSVYEICNPHQAKRALEANWAVSTALPCRISVFGSEGNYKIATMLPSQMMKAFGAPGLDAVADEVERSVIAIVKESA